MSTAETGRVTMDIDGHVGTITVDNTTKKNAYTPAMLDTKKAAMAYIEGGEQAAGGCIPAIKAQAFATEDFKEGIQSFVERRKARLSSR